MNKELNKLLMNTAATVHELTSVLNWIVEHNPNIKTPDKETLDRFDNESIEYVKKKLPSLTVLVDE